MNTVDTDKLFKVVSSLISEAPQRGATDALEKLARSHALTPAEVSFVATAFNKSKAVHMLKAAAREQNATPQFDLADPEKVVSRVFGSDGQKVASGPEEPKLLTRDVSLLDLQAPLQKAANAPAEPLSKLPRETLFNSVYSSLQKCADLLRATRKELSQNLAFRKIALERALDEVVLHVRSLLPDQWDKMARLVVNGYPETGQQFMRLLAAKLGREPGVLQKTAAAAVFPPTEPFLSIAKVHRYAQEVAQASRAIQAFEKQGADSFLEDLAAGLATQAISGTGLPKELGSPLSRRMTPAQPTDETLDPEFFNKIKELEARSALFDLLLYDPDVRQHAVPDVLKAFNDTLQMVPESKGKPAILRNLVLGNLETGGVKDPFRAQQELGLRKLLLETGKLEQEVSGKGPKKQEVRQG